MSDIIARAIEQARRGFAVKIDVRPPRRCPCGPSPNVSCLYCNAYQDELPVTLSKEECE